MGIRDEEIQRLIHYGKGLGVKIVIYSRRNSKDSAEWTLDGSLIEVYAGPSKSKTEIILDLIHELGHHVWFIHEKDRQPDLKFEQAIVRENIFEEEGEIPTPKHLRKKIWDVELAGSQWWDTIVKDTNIKIPGWKIQLGKEFDMWVYEMYYETGHFPKRKESVAHYKVLLAKYKP